MYIYICIYIYVYIYIYILNISTYIRTYLNMYIVLANHPVLRRTCTHFAQCPAVRSILRMSSIFANPLKFSRIIPYCFF